MITVPYNVFMCWRLWTCPEAPASLRVSAASYGFAEHIGILAIVAAELKPRQWIKPKPAAPARSISRRILRADQGLRLVRDWNPLRSSHFLGFVGGAGRWKTGSAKADRRIILSPPAQSRRRATRPPGRYFENCLANAAPAAVPRRTLSRPLKKDFNACAPHSFSPQ
jgi:hypothetical protein